VSKIDMIVAVIIRPTIGKDNWDDPADAPFDNIPLGGANGYILADSNVADVGFVDYKLMEGTLVDVGEIYNQFDFIQETTDDRTGRNISQGIGGLAKLKDWQIQIFDDGTLIDERILGKSVELRVYDPAVIENDSEAKHTTMMVGVINKTTLSDQIWTINCQGNITNNNPRIAGSPVVDFEGNISNNWIFVGETTEDTLIELNLVQGSAEIQITHEPDKYTIEELYVKDKTVNEFYKVREKYLVDPDGTIYFEDSRRVLSLFDLDENDTSLQISDYAVVSILWSKAEERAGTTIIVVTKYHSLGHNTKLIKLTEVTDDDGNIWVRYKCSQSFYDQLERYDFKENQITYAISVPSNLGYRTPKLVTKVEEPLINTPRYIDRYTDYHIPDLLALTQGMYEGFGSRFAAIGEGGNTSEIIKIDDEEMLVIYAQSEWRVNRHIQVVRGYNGTTKAFHPAKSEIRFLTGGRNRSVKIKVNLDPKRLHGVTSSMDTLYKPHIKPELKDFNEWVDKKKDSFEVSLWTDTKQKVLDNKYAFHYQTEKLFAIFGYNYPDLDVHYMWSEFESDMNIHNNPNKATEDGKAFSSIGYTDTRQAVMATLALPMLPSARETQFEPSNIMNSTSYPLENWSSKGHILSRSWFGVDKKDENNYSKAASSITGFPLLRFDPFNAFFTGLSACSLAYNFDSEFDITNPPVPKAWENYQKTTARMDMKGSWGSDWFISRYYDRYPYYLKTQFSKLYYRDRIDGSSSGLRFTNYDNIKDMPMSVCFNVMYLVKSFEQYNVKATIRKFRLRLALYCYIKDNSWWAKVKMKGDGGSIIITDTSALGANASMYYDKDNRIIIAESDTIPLVIFELTLVGTLIQKDIATLVMYPDLGNGVLGQLDNTIDEISKIVVDGVNFKRIDQYDDASISYPNINHVQGQVETNNLKYNEVGVTEFETDEHKVLIESGNLNIYRKTKDFGNPVDGIKFLMETYAKHGAGQFDTAKWIDIAKYRQNWKMSLVIQDEINTNEIVSEVAKNHGLVVYENNKGLISIADLVPPDADEVTFTLNDSHIINRDSIIQIDYERLDNNYIITDLDCRFKPLGNLYREVIEAEDLGLDQAFDLAKKYTDNVTEVALNLRSIYNKYTDLQSASLKMLFHKFPARNIILELRFSQELATLEIGTWLLVSSAHIDNTTDKLYLIIQSQVQVPMESKDGYVKLKLYEYDSKRMNFNIQERPLVEVRENYNEVPTVVNPDDRFTEVTDTGGL